MIFQVFDAPSAGNSLGGSVNTNGVAVSNGLFTATLDFGAAFRRRLIAVERADSG